MGFLRIFLDRNRFHNPIESNATREFIFPVQIGDMKARLIVFNGEGHKPHFHILVNGVLFTSIRLDVPKYYFHKESCRILTDEQVEALIKFLKTYPYRSDHQDNGYHINTVWDWMVHYWDFDYRNIRKVDRKKNKMPDYTKLKTHDYDHRHIDNHRGFINF